MKKSKKDKQLEELELKIKQQEEEEEEKRLKKEEKERAKRATERIKELIKRETYEHERRNDVLVQSTQIYKALISDKVKDDIREREEKDWQLYLKCDGKPNPRDVIAMNMYLYLWQQEKDSDHMEHLITKYDEVVELLDVLDDVIDNPLNASVQKRKNWNEVRIKFHLELQRRIDNATYHILSDIDKNMERLDLEMVQYFKDTNHFIIGLWTQHITPRPWNYEPTIPAIVFEFGINITPPTNVATEYYVVRVLWVKYDQYSSSTLTWEARPLPEEYQLDLLTLNNAEFEEREKIKAEHEEELRAKHRKKKKKKYEYNESTDQDRVSEATIAKDVDQQQSSEGIPKMSLASLEKADTKYVPVSFQELEDIYNRPLEVMSKREAAAKAALKTKLSFNIKNKQISLREYILIGGIIHVGILEQPSQPVVLPDMTVLTVINGEPKIRPLDVVEKNACKQPPTLLKQRTLEKSMTIQSRISTTSKAYEAKLESRATVDSGRSETRNSISSIRWRPAIPEDEQMQNLTKVSIKLPNTVCWFSQPIPVLWNELDKAWTKQNIHKISYDEDNKVLTFRLATMSSPIGLAVPKYYNMPYRNWEMYPENPGVLDTDVILKLTCQRIIVEFKISVSKVCLKSVQNIDESIFKKLIGVYYKPLKLIRALRHLGIAIFPSYDAFIYMDVDQKNWIAENHTYQCMAMCSTNIHFYWSKWNKFSSCREMVCQVKEFFSHEFNLPAHTVLITSERALCVNCNESSDEFPTIDILEHEFHPDLYSLIRSICSTSTANRINRISKALVQTVFILLSKIRFFSFSD